MEKVIDWLVSYYHTGASLTEKIVVFLISIAVIVAGFAKIFEAIIKAIQFICDGYSSLAARRIGGKKRSEWIKRKRQFLNVLASDLSAIAKAEAWNDQHFTDLEAEVEVDGRYYASAFRRLLRKKSSGLRRESSLISAIDGSSERCLLLVGDPGAGKSVALRHLALQLIQRSTRSKKETAVVPLYINLREMPLHGAREITADAVKSFVIDNIRRGDADTADYVRQNWSDFQERGIWFFLFDSFDEIPDVMHAAAADQMVLRYGEALRMFMDGLGACRGVLASREYKCPGTLHWPKLRILPLSERLQEELISRTFLSAEEKAIALQHVSLSSSATFRNPLFLTLLARYVRKNGFAPVNEHELLYDQLSTLANRDADYVHERWRLNGELILQGASELARIFALAPQLSLAPTLVEIQAAAAKLNSFLGLTELPQLIEALTYVKIGRTDVASGDSSVRRFAFSHRRYQECLFALYLLQDQDAIQLDDLILDTRWREYLVALLQIASADRIQRIVLRAAEILASRVDAIPVLRRRFFGQEIRSYDWNDPALEHVLGVFLEAKLYSVNGPWEILSEPIEKLLGGAWSKGDFYDKSKVIKYCGVGSVSVLATRVEVAVNSGIPQFQEEALGACRFLTSHSRALGAWVRGRVALGVVCSVRKFQALRWEAMAAGLPESFQIDIVVSRAKSLNRLRPFYRFHLLAWAVLDRVGIFKGQSHVGGLRSAGVAGFGFFVINILYASLVSGFIAVKLMRQSDSWMSLLVALSLVVVSVYLLGVFVRITCLIVPQRLNPLVVFTTWSKAYKRVNRKLVIAGVSTLMILAPGVIFYWVCKITGWREGSVFDLAASGTVIFHMILGTLAASFTSINHKRVKRKAASLLAVSGGFRGAVSVARSFPEVLELCRLGARSLPSAEARSAIAMFSVLEQSLRKGTVVNGPAWLDDASPSGLRIAIAYFLERAIAVSPTVS